MKRRIYLLLFSILFLGTIPSSAQAPTASPDGFIPAKPGYAWRFPYDHGAHPDYHTEWWYYSGHLQDGAGKRYGFELAFFRVGLGRKVDNPSSFAAKDLYFAHFALSDLKEKRFWYAERMNRPGPGLAGAKPGVLDLFNGGWEAFHETTGHRLQAQDGPYSLDLKLTSPFPPTLEGPGGYSLKDSANGQGSLYYSFPLMQAEGSLGLDGKPVSVSGRAWMDHEFFTEKPGGSLKGWDWFGLQFNDGSELMLYRLRRADGSLDPASSGTFVNAGGKATHLRASDIQAKPLESWKSPRTGVAYPIRWAIEVPVLGLSFEADADIPDQELDTAKSTQVLYWEGSVSAKGTRGKFPVKGEGYMELTGYNGKAPTL